jgi:molybdopterin biosynthesis enzyme
MNMDSVYTVQIDIHFIYIDQIKPGKQMMVDVVKSVLYNQAWSFGASAHPVACLHIGYFSVKE